jgi:hypothetical protein
MPTIEARIAESVVDAALALGYQISVNDGEETTLRRSVDRKAILNALRTTDQDFLFFSKGTQNFGFIWLVWGNGEDLISDCTSSDEIQEIDKAAEKLRLSR